VIARNIFNICTMTAPTNSGMALTYEKYVQTVHGIWVGKFIGGTLGAPIEGIKEIHGFDAELQVPATHAENDDTDLQLLWLHALQEHGVELRGSHLVAEWREHVRAPWNEYGVAAANWDRGLMPPESGQHNNWFWGEGMGCPIRSEIWGAICPGAPDVAARFAEMDASLDHLGNSVQAEKFLAAMQAALFFEKDIRTLILLGLDHIDPQCRLSELIKSVLDWSIGMTWQDCRSCILREFGHPDMTNVLQNLGFTLIGLLYGEGDFGRTVVLALNCGYDSDCTAASAGAIIGGVLGYDRIPIRWRLGVSDRYVVSDWLLGFPRSGSIEELTRSTCEIGEKVAKHFQTGLRLFMPINIPAVPALSVIPQDMTNSPQGVALNGVCWRIVGPFWRNWDERRVADTSLKEHGAGSTLPSAQYFSHNQSGFDCDFITAGAIADPVSPSIASSWLRVAEDDRLPLTGLAQGSGPVCYYATAVFHSSSSRRLWLLVGSTGPVEIWCNGHRFLRSESYQPLTPNTFPVEFEAVAGDNRIVLKLARTSQPLGACVSLKRHEGRHWHQAFVDTTLTWSRTP
jgi:ADP-ribosylglycohydrolase